jgi:endonuclease/exonuclease/phosphatase (EEP) superfamily protein YafD
MRSLLLGFGAAFVAAATVLPEVKSTAWWIRFWDFPRVQLMAIAVGLLAGSARLPRGAARTALFASLSAAVAWQAAKIWRYTRLAGSESLPARSADPRMRARLMIGNVWMPNRNAAGLLDLVRDCDPDLILLLEPNRRWKEDLSELDRSHPYGLKCPLENTYGMLLYSRLPLTDARTRFLLLEDVPSMFCRVHLPGGVSFELYCLHPLPPGVAVDTTQRDAELVMVGREAKKSGAPSVVAGDLNDVAWSETTRLFQKLSGLLDPRIGRGLFNTYNARWPLLRWPLDHLFHSRSFRLAGLRRLPAFGSDHFAIVADLSYEPEAAGEQQPPRPDAEDLAHAREKLESAREEGLL